MLGRDAQLEHLLDDKTLDRFLAKPLAMVPGGTMTCHGVADVNERVDLIACLRRAKQTPECRKSRPR